MIGKPWGGAVAAALCLSLVAPAALSQDCAFPDESESFAIRALQTRLMVDGLNCRAGDEYNRFVARFGPQLSRAEHGTRAFYARTSPGNPGPARDRWNTNIANAWSESAMRAPDTCGAARRLAAEALAVAPGSGLLALAERVNEPVRRHLPPACRRSDEDPAPLRLP